MCVCVYIQDNVLHSNRVVCKVGFAHPRRLWRKGAVKLRKWVASRRMHRSLCQTDKQVEEGIPYRGHYKHRCVKGHDCWGEIIRFLGCIWIRERGKMRVEV